MEIEKYSPKWLLEKINDSKNDAHKLMHIIEYRKELVESTEQQLILSGVSSSLPDLAECNQASLDYATKKNNPDFFLIKQTFKDGVNWALNYVTRPK